MKLWENEVKSSISNTVKEYFRKTDEYPLFLQQNFLFPISNRANCAQPMTPTRSDLAVNINSLMLTGLMLILFC